MIKEACINIIDLNDEGMGDFIDDKFDCGE